eukprot:gene1279-420_t
MELKIRLGTPEDTEAFGVALARHAQKGDVIFLNGNLGAGKTSVARGFVRSFFKNETMDVPSPTYLLYFSYNDTVEEDVEKDKENKNGKAFHVNSVSRIPGCTVHHVDPYRLPVGKIASLIDLESCFKNDISLIEWPCHLGEQLVSETTPERLEITIGGSGVQGLGREVVLKAVGEKWEKRLGEFEISKGSWLEKKAAADARRF